MNLFFNFIGDSFRHTVLSKRLFETKSADINFRNLIAYTFLVSKVISHSKVDQNITNVSDVRNCDLDTKTKRFPLTTSVQ